MTTRVIDSSVVLAVIFGEPGEAKAAKLVRGGVLSSVSLAEIVAKCLKRTAPVDLAMQYVRHNNMEIAGFDEDMGMLAGALWKNAPDGVLSLGDRACIATAIRLGAIAITTDRIWADLDLPCPVELIR